MAENFPKLVADSKPQIQEAQRMTNKLNIKKKNTPRHIIFKLQKTKVKEKFPKTTKKKIVLPIEEQG